MDFTHEQYQYALIGYLLCMRWGHVRQDNPGMGNIAWYWQTYMT